MTSKLQYADIEPKSCLQYESETRLLYLTVRARPDARLPGISDGALSPAERPSSVVLGAIYAAVQAQGWLETILVSVMVLVFLGRRRANLGYTDSLKTAGCRKFARSSSGALAQPHHDACGPPDNSAIVCPTPIM